MQGSEFKVLGFTTEGVLAEVGAPLHKLRFIEATLHHAGPPLYPEGPCTQ